MEEPMVRRFRLARIATPTSHRYYVQIAINVEVFVERVARVPRVSFHVALELNTGQQTTRTEAQEHCLRREYHRLDLVDRKR
jgi:hypothetical protein